MLVHLSGLREILGRLPDGDAITEDQATLEYSDDGETMKRAVIIQTTPKVVIYKEVEEQ